MILGVLLLGTLTPSLSAQNIYTGRLEAEIWQALDPIPPNQVERDPVTPATFLKSSFEEARQWFSGMIYGLQFRYQPSDLRRQVPEVVELKFLGEISWGDKALRFVDHRVEEKEGRIYLRFTYELNDSQKLYLESGRRQNNKPAGGRGVAPFTFEPTDRWEALKAAVREGLRSYLRPREYNKPRLVTGTLFLREPPFFQERAGEIHCTASFFLNVAEVREYLIP